jgi:pimeloyl-ACP methyl ester carboxylesterase
LVIAGKNDPIVPAANAQFLADRLPRNRLCLLDAGHRVWDEATDSYSRQIASWFGGEYSNWL